MSHERDLIDIAASLLSPDPQRRAALEVLLSRQSVSALQEPAPDDADLALILEAGLRAPDHGRLRPWRFVLIRGAARAAFAEVLIEALREREPDPPEFLVERQRLKLQSVPLLIAIGAKIEPDGHIPKIEQLLSVGAAAMNMLNAIHALGYGGIWVTGANVYDRRVNQALGLAWPDRLAGFLFVGTPQGAPRPVRRPLLADHCGSGRGEASHRRRFATGPRSCQDIGPSRKSSQFSEGTMRATSLDELAWLHDCDVTKIAYDFTREDGKSIALTMRCPEDLGYAPWEGKTLTLVLVDVRASRQILWSTHGLESLDAVQPGISDDMRQEILRTTKLGARYRGLECTLVFHSGSWIELICRELQVDISISEHRPSSNPASL